MTGGANSAESCCGGKQSGLLWYPGNGIEQLFDLTTDPHELHSLAVESEHEERLAHWRRRLIGCLAGRPEGVTDGKRLIPGRPYDALPPHVHGVPASG